MKKKCTKCNKYKSLDHFYSGTNPWCRECNKEYSKNQYHLNKKKNPKKFKEERRNSTLKYKYDITLKEYNHILKKQNYKCGICGKHQSKLKRNLAVDHNHVTKFIRGLLCNYCNSYLLMAFRDSKQKAKGIIKYLAKALKEDKLWE